MASYEVSEPSLNSPFEKPNRYWYIQEGEPPELRDGRRPPVVFPPRDQKEEWTETPLLRRSKEYPAGYEMALVSLIRERLESWSGQGFPGVTRAIAEGKVIEDYPNDKPYPSRLLLGRAENRPIHVVTATAEHEIIVIAVYEPDPGLWEDGFERRREK